MVKEKEIEKEKEIGKEEEEGKKENEQGEVDNDETRQARIQKQQSRILSDGTVITTDPKTGQTNVVHPSEEQEQEKTTKT